MTFASINGNIMLHTYTNTRRIYGKAHMCTYISKLMVKYKQQNAHSNKLHTKLQNCIHTYKHKNIMFSFAHDSYGFARHHVLYIDMFVITNEHLTAKILLSLQLM
ncbi:unnamed protein product [Ceratitis capitata]|uniref:(Mediterranean fruit fly) hypothetical protein n=1 Tax=Ceratitis capitata TaxID=7213 RepID=A0A811UT69_CERCA|nr:unnamed protein product [Ceratitis capitata]